MKRKLLLYLVCAPLLFTFVFSTPVAALEYQWKFVIPQIVDSKSAVQVFELLHSIPGVYDVNINIERNSAIFSFDDEKTDEDRVKQHLQNDSFTVDKMMLMEEPREGVMN